jgi:hypothetical protein
MYKKDPLASGILDASLRRYMGPQEQYWGDDDNRDEEPTYVYYLDPKRFEEFKDELDALDEYYQDDDWTEDDRDWERGQTFARWAERPDGTFQLQLCKSDNTEIGYRYRKVGAFVPVDYISGGWVLEAEIGEPLALNDWHWVRPDNATDKTITWSVKDPGSTGAAITGNILTATALGDAIVTGTVANGKGEGKPYTEDRTVTVKGPIVPHGDFVLRDILGGVELAQYLGNDTEVVIPGDLGITALGPASFQLSAMTSVVVPEGVTEIDQAAFLESYSLTSVTLPQSLRIIREEAFNACPALSSMRVEAGTPPSVADGFLGFQAPANLTAIYVPAASVDAYKAADGWKKHASLITAIVP